MFYKVILKLDQNLLIFLSLKKENFFMDFLSTCDSCGRDCHTAAKTCPWCGRPNPVSRRSGILKIILRVLCTGILVFGFIHYYSLEKAKEQVEKKQIEKNQIEIRNRKLRKEDDELIQFRRDIDLNEVLFPNKKKF